MNLIRNAIKRSYIIYLMNWSLLPDVFIVGCIAKLRYCVKNRRM
jgi:hypothetical protein